MSKENRYKWTSFALLFMLVLDAGWRYFWEDPEILRYVKNGVEIVEYHSVEKWLPRYTLRLQEQLSISGSFRDSVFIPFGKLQDLMVDQNKNIFIVERNTSRIYKFSQTGKLLQLQPGRKGLGPGESMAPGPMFFQKGLFYWLSQSPQKIIALDLDLNFIKEMSLKPRTVFWIFRDRRNEPIFFLTLDLLAKKTTRNAYSKWLRAFHTYNSPFLPEIPYGLHVSNGGKRQGNTLVLDYTVPAFYVLAPDCTFWINNTIEYTIELRKMHNHFRTIKIDYPPIKLSDKEKNELKQKAMERNFVGILNQAGLRKKVINFPELHKQIASIDLLNEEIWVSLFASKSKSSQQIHVYDFNGRLIKLVLLEGFRFEQTNKKYIVDDMLYVIQSDDQNGYTTVKRYKMQFL
ncbi:MAG: hypothetical protein Q9P14_15555 [candidate division KSB1 bacterium]|nr:hypothetical protein [candidate division KSB1 bacterium]